MHLLFVAVLSSSVSLSFIKLAVSIIEKNSLPKIVVFFFVLTRLHFYTKLLNKDRSVQWQEQKHLYIARTEARR